MKDISEMTILELRDYLNTLSNEELDEIIDTIDLSDLDADLDVMDLLKAPRLYDYMQHRNGGNATIEF